MPVAILIITHGEIGQQFINTAQSTLGGKLPLTCRALSVPPNCDPEKLMTEAECLLQNIDEGDGLLILTDMYGSTPSNIATHFEKRARVHVIAGINLPMFIRALNYPDLNLAGITEKALSGGHDGIMLCQQTN